MKKKRCEQHEALSCKESLTRSNMRTLIVLVMFSIILIPAFTIAQESTGNIGDKGYEELLRRIEILAKRLQDSEAKREALSEEVNRLKAEKPAKAETIVAEPEATIAQTAQPGGPEAVSSITAGWDKGPFIKSRDGRFEFRPVGILHLDFRGHEKERQINNNDTLASTFDVRRFRMGFEGFVFEKIGYNFEMHFDEDDSELIFAYLNFGHIPWANVRVGQFKEPFSYEVLYPEKYLDFVERANITSSIAPAEDIGIMVHNFGRPYEGIFEYGLGIFNGEGVHLNDAENADMEFAGRVAVLPFVQGPEWAKKAKIALNATYTGDQRRESGFRARTSEKFELFPRLAVDGERLRWGGDIQWFYGPVSAKFAYMRAKESRSNGLPDLITDGWHVDGTWLITGEEKILAMKSGWELAARYEEIRADAQERFRIQGYTDGNGNPLMIRDNLVRSVTLGINKYLNYHMKVQLNYQRDWYDNAFYTPTSREGESILTSGDDSVDKILARIQLMF
jgi:phosphate-selective porin OprO and OprP